MKNSEKKMELIYVYYKLFEVVYLLQEEEMYKKEEAIKDILKVLAHIEALDKISFNSLLAEYKNIKH
ncbi:hypothetical protein [Sutcliffiella halmapala]|uniref:hypothetical protein n=1 Tax=Sutcliffiella halmapala TaxID=79882 RepID=UPI000994FBA9|nr:hypothetical protein [Sutcliffiella halmapala]